tara:strand:- start:833 stop:1294 length:462 start_codon:yes stop_codon:yes gene_type:complete
MSELEFKKFGKGLVINDGSKKGFGSIKPLANKDQAGNKYQLKVNNPKGIPTSILNEKQDKLLKKGVISETQRKFVSKLESKGLKNTKVKSIAEAKKLAKKIFRMFRGGGAGQELPIEIQQGPRLVNLKKKKYSKGGLSTKKYANAVTMVNNLR